MRKVDFVLAILVFVLPLGLYIRSLAPTYIPIDSAEFTMCMHYWGICHPPGFPLYVLLGKIFLSVLPFGSVIWRANLFSAIFGAATILVSYLAALVLKVDRKVAFLSTLFLAVSGIFWEFSLSADVFSFGTFLIALAFLLAFSKRQLLSLFVLGLSASHFYITGALFPLFVWYFLKEAEGYKDRETERGSGFYSLRRILPMVIVFGLGFFPQAVMFFRMQQSPEINWGHAKGIGGFIDYVRRKEFGSIFLIANPVLVFSPVKLFSHFAYYFRNLFFDLGVALPLFALASFFAGKFRDRRFVFLLLSFLILVFVQLFLLSTIDPGGEDNPFQLNKFYLSSFVIVVLLGAIGINFISEKLFAGEKMFATVLLSFLIFIYFISNFRTLDFSKNRFSENFVLDAMEQLPSGALVVTVDHVAYFGALYEQKVNGKFRDITLIYVPNDKNLDSQYYHPEVFSRQVDSRFVQKVSKDKRLGRAEQYVLETIAKNMNREMFILQGVFEETFFSYLKPYIVPYGLWWKVDAELGSKVDYLAEKERYGELLNKDFKKSDFFLRQQGQQSVTYAISYNSIGVELAAQGQFDEALEFFNMSLAINDKADSVRREIELVAATRDLWGRREELARSKDIAALKDLGRNLFTLTDYEDSVRVYGEILEFGGLDAEVFNNLASSLANLGRAGEARENYLKALEINPNLDLAKQGLKALDSK